MVVGETVNTYITRKRIEKTAAILMRRKNASIGELALEYGFTSNASFTRAFKKFYGVSPTAFRKLNPGKFSKIGKVESKNGKENKIFEKYICDTNNHLKWIKMNASIEIKTVPELNFVRITHIGIQGIENTFDRLIQWSRSEGLYDDSEAKMARVFHDSFKVTAPDLVRMSVCLLTAKKVKTEGEVSTMKMDEGKYIVARFQIKITEYEKSWSSLFVWMNQQGYKKRPADPFELYENDFRTHPEQLSTVDFYIPIF